jgi:hypothetical protein
LTVSVLQKIDGGCHHEECVLEYCEPLPPQAPIPPPLPAQVRQTHEEALVAGATPEAIVPPGQVKMVDTWSDYSGC